MRRLRITVPTLLAVLIAGGCAHGQRGARTEPVTISGTVRNSTGSALIGAMLFVSGTRFGTITNDSGAYVLHVPADSVEDPLPLAVLLIGHETIDERIAIGRSNSLTRDFVLKEMAIRLDGLDVPEVNTTPVPSCTTPGSAAPVDAPYALFSWRLFHEIVAGMPDENVFVSPVSAASALAIAFEGARGSTAEAFGAVLGVGADDARSLADRTRTWRESMLAQDCVDLTIANAIWTKPGVAFDSGFAARTREVHDAEVDTLGQGAAARVNAWASDKTRGRITRVISDPIDEILVLTNAVYFKGMWDAPFDTSRTRDAPFHLAGGDSVDVPMMSRTGGYRYAERDGYRLARLSYRGGRFAMYVLLPDAGSLPVDVLERLDRDSLPSIIAGARNESLALSVPRLTLNDDYDLKAPLSGLGLGIAFDSGAADLSGFVDRRWLGGERLYISRARQAVFLEMNEEGTEAAAVTSIGIVVTGFRTPTPFIVDRPFLMLIRDDETGAILFIGQILDPS